MSTYFCPYVDEFGLHISNYEDIKQELVKKMKVIYGNDIYLGIDSQDYQMISAFALMLYDTLQSLLLVYNNSSPLTAVGTGLDRLVQLNGITRREPTNSTCLINLVGVSGTRIINGVVQDINEIKWMLPELVTIPVAGEIDVIATCVERGPIQIQVGGINQIVTPVQGWSSATNEILATIGDTEEVDSELRARQIVSSSIVARTIMDSIISSILNLSGVKKVKGYENDTNALVGVYPAHSITLVVQGGVDLSIATEIYWRKTLGTSTFGNTAITVVGMYDSETIINFQRPTEVIATVALGITSLPSYSSTVLADIKTAIIDYIGNLQIGEDLYVSNLYGAIFSASTDFATPPFYITTLTVNAQSSIVDVTDFQILVVEELDITITVT